MKHTKGEWKVVDNDVFFEIGIGASVKIGDVCASKICFDNNNHHKNGETYANALLMAAAPDLLEALIEIRKLVDHHDKADHAIAKAKGEL